MRHIRHNRRMRFDCLRDHLSPPQTYFLLDRIDNIKAERQFNLPLMQQSGHFGNAEAPHAVVERTAGVVAIVDDLHFIIESNHAANMHTGRQHLVFVFRSDIDENIVELGLQLIVFPVARVNGRPAKYASYDTFRRMNIHPFGRRDDVIRPPVAHYVDETIVSNVMHKPRDFIGMCLNNYPIILPWIDDTISSTIVVQTPVINERLDILQPELLPAGFKAGRRRVVEVRTQESL